MKIKATSIHPVKFRDSCYTAHCNEYCPEDIDLQLDNSYLWSSSVEILVYCIIGIVTMVCFIMKGIFFAWHWWLLHKITVYSMVAVNGDNVIIIMLLNCELASAVIMMITEKYNNIGSHVNYYPLLIMLHGNTKME